VDLVSQAGLNADVWSYLITAGFLEGAGTVPKKDLVGAVQAALQSRRLRLAESLPLTPTLARELETFRIKITGERNDTYPSWRERPHDDLVLALALALWYGERHPHIPTPVVVDTSRPPLDMGLFNNYRGPGGGWYSRGM
jgi:hypothetical protein